MPAGSIGRRHAAHRVATSLPATLLVRKADFEGRDNLAGEARLDCEDILGRSFETVGPQMGVACCVDELCRDPQLAGGTPYAALEQVLHSQLGAQGARVQFRPAQGQR